MLERVNKITTGYQITIPLDYRKKNNLKIGDYIVFKNDGTSLIIEPLKEGKKATEAFDALFKQKISADKLNKHSEKQIIAIVDKEIKNHRKKNAKTENRH
jgi:bifunctional DNA-binding transcriptional regulator/antitoxin component of YhaV-PrlF toxin-antitoxin module